MDYFGINSTDDLPKIKEVLADQIVEATVIKPEDFTDNSVLEQTAEEDANASDIGDDLSEEETPNLPAETGDFEAESDEADTAPESPAE
jgi:segregation and condensation protein B